MKGLGAVHDHIGIRALHAFRRCVEQRPRIPGTEVLIGWLPPFFKDGRDLAWRDRLTVHCLDHEIMRLGVGDAAIPIPGNALVDLEKPLPQLSDCSRGQMPEITLGELGVLARDSDFPAKCEIVADEDFRASDEAGWIGLVMRVPDPDDPAIITISPAREVHLEETEVATPFMGKGMMFSGQAEARGLQLGLDFMDKARMSERIPCIGADGCRYVVDRPTVDQFGAAVKKHSLRRHLLAGCWIFNELIHNVFVF